MAAPHEVIPLHRATTNMAENESAAGSTVTDLVPKRGATSEVWKWFENEDNQRS